MIRLLLRIVCAFRGHRWELHWTNKPSDYFDPNLCSSVGCKCARCGSGHFYLDAELVRGNKIKYLLLALGLAALSGCVEPDRRVPDQELRRRLFFECLKSAPAGPQSTKYNDWDEVVSECGDQALMLSYPTRTP